VLVLVVLLDGTIVSANCARAIGGVSEKMLAQTLTGWLHDGYAAGRPAWYRPMWNTA
jgi:DNA-binding HxlR family transcriptional regulator